MAVEVILPKVDMDMETGQISRWYAKQGDVVAKGQLLFEIETDKAAMEVDSPASGTLANVSAEEGAKVPVGQTVAWILEEGESASAIPDENTAESRVSVEVEEPEPPASKPTPTTATATQKDGSLRATPLARRLARDAGIDLAGVQGSGPKGRIQSKDVEAATATKQPAAHVDKAPLPASAHTGEKLNAVWLREGDSTKLPVVLIHGFASDLNSWRGLFAGVSLGHPIFALDLPGHGNSPRIVPESIDAFAEAVETTLTANGISSCVLVGHSLGGAVATVLAARGQIDVRSLLLISSAGLGPEVNGAFINGIIGAKSEDSITPWLKLMVADGAVITKPFIKVTYAQAQDQELRAAQAGIADRFFPYDTQAIDIRPQLQSLAMPVRLIFGADDRVIPVSQTRSLPGKVGVHIFANCGHMPQLEERSAVFQILSECVRATDQ